MSTSKGFWGSLRTQTAFAILIALGLSACDQDLIPLQPSDAAFSIYGHLDPAADTQWVRVAPIRTTILSSADPVDAIVTIEDLGTGRMIELIPTLFKARSGNFGDTLFAYNFRTSDPLEYGSTYRLTAKSTQGTESSSIVATPTDLSHLPIFVTVQREATDFNPLTQDPLVPIRFPMAEGDHIAMVQVYNYAPDTLSLGVPPTPTAECASPPVITYTGPSNFTAAEPGYYRGNVRRELVMQKAAPCNIPYDRREFRIVRTREPWPFAVGGDYSYAQAVNTIENGVGFLGGVATKWVPIERCIVERIGSGPLPTSCDFVYGPETVTLTVDVDHEWALGPMEGFGPILWIRKEGDLWRRQMITTPSWDRYPPITYQVSGHLPARYHLRVDSPPGSYCEERILDLTPGETVVEITLVRRIDFPNEPVNANGCREG